MPQPNLANPFGRNITADYFVGREPELRRFQTNLAGLRNRQPNHEYVAGLEGTGKTYYLHKVAGIARSEDFVATVVTLDANVTPFIQIKTIIGEIINGLQEQWHAAKPEELPRRELEGDWTAGTQAKLFRQPRQDVLLVSDLKQDFITLARHVIDYGFQGVVVGLDEGQRIAPLALSGLKNALEDVGTVQVVLSWRLSSDAGGAVEAGRRAIRDCAATAAEQDQGAARLFGIGTAMGPFTTDAEVRRFFSARLSGKSLQFSDGVCMRLGEIADRVPGRIIDLAGKVYDRALRDQVTNVEISLMNDCFQERHPEELKQAVDLCAELPQDMLDILRALCVLPKAATALELVDHAFPNLQDPFRAGYAEGKAARLDDLCKSSPALLKDGDKFAAANSVFRYALKIALRTT